MLKDRMTDTIRLPAQLAFCVIILPFRIIKTAVRIVVWLWKTA